jgi:hypothetical protein
MDKNVNKGVEILFLSGDAGKLLGWRGTLSRK